MIRPSLFCLEVVLIVLAISTMTIRYEEELLIHNMDRLGLKLLVYVDTFIKPSEKCKCDPFSG